MERYLAQRSAHVAEAEPGIAAARELARLTDEAVRDLARAASSRPKGRWALVALGGWGAGALQPASDLDILVLADARGEGHKPFIESILYPLWDAGLKVGHQTRTPKEQLRAMREDLATLTAALTARPIAGDEAWAAATIAAAIAEVSRRPARAYAHLAERERPGSAYLLEPHLKEGRGGRRDYDELVWAAAIAGAARADSPRALVAAGVLSERELETVTDAAATVAAARWVLQRERVGDRWVLEADDLIEDPEALQRALAETALVLDRARGRLAHTPLPEGPLDAASLFTLLDAGSASLPALERAAQAGDLDDLVPGLRALMTTRRPGLGHELTVGAHSLAATTLLPELPAQGGPLAHSAQAVSHPRALQVAALTHDAGKREPGPGHPERGRPIAAETARRCGLGAAESEEAAALVGLHLSLVEAALQTDLDDEDAVLATAAIVGDRDLVAPLHLLTAADSIATGPGTWNEWVAALVAALVARLDAALSDEVDGAGLATRGEAVRAATLSALPPDADALAAYVRGAPVRYLAAREPARVAAHARLVTELAEAPLASPARVAVGAGPTEGSFVVSVAAIDRPELFARIAGALALSGLDILSADAFGAGGGLALDEFVVAPATLRPVDTATWATFERVLRAALTDRLELETRLAERRRHYPARATRSVTVDTDARPGTHTIVRVDAPDRPGLLYELARAVSQVGLDIRWAKAVTIDGVAVDTFHVTDSNGGAVTDPGVLGHLAMQLRSVG